MTDSPNLPGQHGWIDSSGKPLPWEFFKFFRDLLRYIQTTAGNTIEISSILARLDALEADQANPDAMIQGIMSVVSQGTLADGLVQLLLEGDDPEPLPVSFYSTDDDSTKGWHPLYPDWIPNPYADYLVDENGDYLVDENGAFLTSQNGFPIPLEYGGTGADNSSVAANLVWASPDGLAGAPVFRTLVADDLPAHNGINSLQGGTAGEYYHLTAAQHTDIAAILAASPIDVTGSRGGNAALASLLTALATLTFITDSTTA